MDRFLREVLLPLLGGPWFVHGGESIVRMHGVLVQAIWMYRSQYRDDFRPGYSVNVLPQLKDVLHGTLGSDLQNERGGELWIRWAPAREGLAEELVRAIRAQAKPSIDGPLTLETVGEYILRHHLKEEDALSRLSRARIGGLKDKRRAHFSALWSYGIIRGLQGRLEEGREYLEATQEQFRIAMRDWRTGEKEPPSWMQENLIRVSEQLAKLTDSSSFAAYCAQESARIKKALKLPD